MRHGESARYQMLLDLVGEFTESCSGLHRLAGDAGNRVYYRFENGNRSWILMDTGHPVDVRHDPFIQNTIYLSGKRLPVPFIRKTWDREGVLILEDLTDTTLQSMFLRDPDHAMAELYPGVLDILVTMHTTCRPGDQPGTPAFNIRFDFRKYMEELHFFKTHFLENTLGTKLDPGLEAKIESVFSWLAQTLVSQPEVYTHRDFHSRNLMIKDGRVFMIDYQDARMGLMEYDLASLLRDAYVRLPELFIEECISRYYDGMGVRGTEIRRHRRVMFALMCIQRNVKALGTFGFQATIRKKTEYLRYIYNLYDHINHEIKNLMRWGTTIPELSPARIEELCVLLQHILPLDEIT